MTVIPRVQVTLLMVGRDIKQFRPDFLPWYVALPILYLGG